MKGTSEHSVTRLLQDWRRGDQDAGQRLIPLVYSQMQRLAQRELLRERTDHTLQSTELVHEAYERLVDIDIPWSDRAHFFAMAARTMRRVLIDQARARQAAKRGGGATPLSLDQLHAAAEPAVNQTEQVDLLVMDESLTALGRIDPRLERVVELYFFAGMTHEEAAEATGSSRATVQRDLRFARAWLRKHLDAR